MPRRLPFLATLVLLAGCASLMQPATERMADQLGAAMLEQSDPQTVRESVPAYLLLLDALLIGDPENPRLLLAAARLNGAYATAFVDDPGRRRILADKAYRYAREALCLGDSPLCTEPSQPLDRFRARLGRLRPQDVPGVQGLAVAWAGRMQAHREDWGLLAQLPQLRATLERLVALNEHYDHGSAHLYLGVIDTLLPARLGGHPEEGRRHFERALALSDQTNLLAKVYYAERYARLVFNKGLHDRLLREVLAADPKAPGLTLINHLAQQRAAELLAGSDDYF